MMKKFKKLLPKQIKTWVKDLLGVTAFDHVSIANNGLQETITRLEKKYRFYQPTLVRFLINFYRYLLQLENDLPQYDCHKLLIIHCCCWSPSYTEKMKNYYFASLLAKNNLPHISTEYKVVVLIHCDEATKNGLIHSVFAEEIKKYATLSFIVLPEHVFSIYQGKLNFLERLMAKKFNFIDTFKYVLLGGFQTHAFKIAMKNKAYISFMMPDVILSDAFFSEMCKDMANKKIAVNTTFRTNFKKMAEKVQQFYTDSTNSVLSIPAMTLTELQIETMHEAAKRRIVSESTKNFSPCAQMLFEAKNGFIVRSFHYHPILINCAQVSADIKMDYFPIDNSALNQMVSIDMPFEQQIVAYNDRTKLAWVELSEDDIEANYAVNPPATRDQLLETINEMIAHQPSLYNTPLNRYFFSIRNEVCSAKVSHQRVSVDDCQFAQELDI